MYWSNTIKSLIIIILLLFTKPDIFTDLWEWHPKVHRSRKDVWTPYWSIFWLILYLFNTFSSQPYRKMILLVIKVIVFLILYIPLYSLTFIIEWINSHTKMSNIFKLSLIYQIYPKMISVMFLTFHHTIYILTSPHDIYNCLIITILTHYLQYYMKY